MRVSLVEREQLVQQAKLAYDAHVEKGSLTNMKEALLLDYATYEAYMGWYTSWARLLEIVEKRTAMIFAHSISTTNSCLLCSLFFIRDLKAAGLDPKNLVMSEKEELLAQLGRQIVTDPTKVSDALFVQLKEHFTDGEIVAIVGFAGQMIATNNFNSVLDTKVDESLLPFVEEFEPATWRKG